MSSQPSLEEIDELGAYLSVTAAPEFEDLNGHINVTGHYQLLMRGEEVAWQQELGIDAARAALGEGTFALAQHVTFFSEILVGEQLSVHLRFIDRSPKVFRALAILMNRTTGKVASTCEGLDAFVNLRTRRVEPMPEDLAQRLDQLIARHSQLTWQLPLNDGLEVRKK